MRVQLSQQATEILGQSELVIITERVDDVALLIGQMVKMGLPEVLDRHILRRPNRCCTGDQLLGSECHRCLFNARWPCVFNDQGLLWHRDLKPIVLSINPFYTDTCLVI
jgi:hypothetical protein